jgi:hypothetical protein
MAPPNDVVTNRIHMLDSYDYLIILIQSTNRANAMYPIYLAMLENVKEKLGPRLQCQCVLPNLLAEPS